jgi:hypothetical protein
VIYQRAKRGRIRGSHGGAGRQAGEDCPSGESSDAANRSSELRPQRLTRTTVSLPFWPDFSWLTRSFSPLPGHRHVYRLPRE